MSRELDAKVHEILFEGFLGWGLVGYYPGNYIINGEDSIESPWDIKEPIYLKGCVCGTGYISGTRALGHDAYCLDVVPKYSTWSAVKLVLKRLRELKVYISIDLGANDMFVDAHADLNEDELPHILKAVGMNDIDSIDDFPKNLCELVLKLKENGVL